MGRHHQLIGIVAEYQNSVKGVAINLRGVCLKIVELLHQRWQQNSIFILKTVFPKKWFNVSFTNPTSTVELQLLSLWLLKTMIIGEKMVWSSYNLDVWWLEIWNMVWLVILHIVSNIRLGLCLESAQGSLEFWMPGTKCETWRQICDDLGSNILVLCWSYNFSEWSISSLKQIQDVLHEEWCIIPLETVKNVCESIPWRIQAITVKWWFNSILINKCVSFTTISLILSIPCSFTCCVSLCYLNSEVLQANIVNQMMAYWSQNT